MRIYTRKKQEYNYYNTKYQKNQYFSKEKSQQNKKICPFSAYKKHFGQISFKKA